MNLHDIQVNLRTYWSTNPQSHNAKRQIMWSVGLQVTFHKTAVLVRLSAPSRKFKVRGINFSTVSNNQQRGDVHPAGHPFWRIHDIRSDLVWLHSSVNALRFEQERSNTVSLRKNSKKSPRNFSLHTGACDHFPHLILDSCSWPLKATWWSASWSGHPWTRRSQSASVCSRVGCSPFGSERCRYPSAPSGPGHSSCGRSCRFLYST